MKKKILIIGGAGFIGHNLALSLIKEKYQVKIIDSLSVNNLKSIKQRVLCCCWFQWRF